MRHYISLDDRKKSLGINDATHQKPCTEYTQHQQQVILLCAGYPLGHYEHVRVESDAIHIHVVQDVKIKFIHKKDGDRFRHAYNISLYTERACNIDIEVLYASACKFYTDIKIKAYIKCHTVCTINTQPKRFHNIVSMYLDILMIKDILMICKVPAFKIHTFVLGVKALLLAHGAKFKFLSVALGVRSNHISHSVVMEHIGQHTQSYASVRAIGQRHSLVLSKFLSICREFACGADSTQEMRGLLVDNTAKIQLEPLVSMYNKTSQVSHHLSIEPVSESTITYLMMHGFTKIQAISLIRHSLVTNV